MIKKFIYRLLLLAAMCVPTSMYAQVTIGSNAAPDKFSLLDLVTTSQNRLGLHLPRLTVDERDALIVTQADTIAAAGLTIYNITANCLEHWNTKMWVSDCNGGSVTIVCNGSGTCCDAFSADGSCTNDYTVDDPMCDLAGEYTFTWIVGEEFIDELNIIDAGAGRFSLSFLSTDRASARNAIMLVTSPCGNSNTFVFTQEGDPTLCNPFATAPKIEGENTTNLCAGGAVYLYLTNGSGTRLTSANGSYVWVLNGQVVAYDTVSYIATKPGKYIVYSNAVGCTEPKPDTLVVAITGIGAPSPVAIIVGVNGGYVCDPASTVRLYVKTPASGTLAWYKDGVKQTITTYTNDPYSYIDATIGSWFAAVEEGGCSSVPSNTIDVLLDPNPGNATTTPTFSVNGTPAGGVVTVCSGGTLVLAVNTPEAGVTYTWYIDNTPVATGSQYLMNMAEITDDFILQCRATSESLCSTAGVAQIIINAGAAPDAPTVDNPTSGHFLCGGDATLVATGSADYYLWYRDAVFLTTTTVPELDITAIGSYTVQASIGGCVSDMSAAYNITGNSGYGSVTIKDGNTPVSGTTINIDQDRMKTFTAEINPTGGETYLWTITGATPTTATGQYVNVSFPTVGTANIILSASNACTSQKTASVAVDVAEYCAPVEIDSYTPASKIAIITTGNVAISAKPNGDIGKFTYSWRKSSDPSTEISTSATYTATAAGTYFVIITAKCVGVPPVQSDDIIVTKAALDKEIIRTRRTGAGVTTNFSDLTANGTVTAVAGATFAWTVTAKAWGGVSTVAAALPTLSGAATTTYTMTTNSAGATIVGGVYDVKVTATNTASGGTASATFTLYVGCGARTASTTWTIWRCHNLGVNESSDPFNPTTSIVGNFYQWGRAAVVATGSTGSGRISGWNTTAANNTALSNTTKTSADPCPSGWRIPTHAQSSAIGNNKSLNPITSVTTGTRGVMLGRALPLPFGGYRHSTDGSFCNNGSDNTVAGRAGYYVSSSYFDAGTQKKFAVSGSGMYQIDQSMSKNNGFNIRCIKQ
ncbi:MAG: hypothetical protein LBN95_10195 [Prevotellaceae bacterium]|jgi:hypothetical protein|nr:hypothetical protein [Prevotellaceae bacterium]